jgi:DNA repair protein RadD
MTELRPYQINAVADINRVVAIGKRRPLLIAPTGAGKTVVVTEIIRQYVAQSKRVVVIAHSREIITQTSLKLSAHSIAHGIILAGLTMQLDEPVQVCSVQTLWARAMRTEKMPLPPADLLIVDEAHHCPARTYRRIIESYPNAILLGATATPCRGDGRGLGGIFDVIVETPQVADLIAEKFLVKTRVYAPVNPDLQDVEVRKGDYVEAQLAERIDRDDLVGDIVTHWHKHGERRKTVCFAINVAHSLHIRNEFIRSGVKAEHIDGQTPKPDRDAVLRRLASGETELVSNCAVLGEGWDLPAVSCIVLARPTRKMGLYRQMVGRVLRPAPDKFNAIVLDHSGAVFRHGFVEDRVDWSLDPERRAESPTHNSRLRSGYSSRLLECSQCSSMRVAGEACPHCGFLPQRPPKPIVFADGDLALVDRKSRTAEHRTNPDERVRWHGMLAHIAAERGYKSGWVSHKFRERFGVWPAARYVAPLDPSPEVLSWVRSRIIAYAKAREKAGAA